MARYIDANKAIELIKNYGKGAISDGQTTLDAVDDIICLAKGVDLIPTADVVEVVRCKDCQHYEADIIAGQIGYCNEHQKGMYEQNFCSYGERKKVE